MIFVVYEERKAGMMRQPCKTRGCPEKEYEAGSEYCELCLVMNDARDEEKE